jgi:heat shock protein HslJ
MFTRRLAALAALALLIAACSAGPGNGGPLEGSDWVLRSYDVDGTLTIVPDNLYADAEFASNRVRGFAGCNDFEALYRAGGRTLFISQPAVTLMACDDETNAFEQAVLAAMDASRFYGVRAQTLTIYGAGRTELLVYDAAPRNPLRGEWNVTGYNNGAEAVVSPIVDTQMDVAFGLASVGGFAGCNSFSGTYGTNGDIIRIGALATTRLACDQEIMDQETAFLEALQGVATIETRGRQVTLRDLRGAIKVTLARPEPLAAPSPESSAEPTEGPTAEASPTPTPSPTPKPTATPTPAPAASPTPTPAPAASPTPTPAASPTPPQPDVATCELKNADGTLVATITYPGAWFTEIEPANVACRYFDPEQFTIPSDPSTLVTAVMASTADGSYGDVVAQATNEGTWDVTTAQELTVDGLPATLVDATAITDGGAVPNGTSRFVYFIDVGSSGTVSLFTTGTSGDEAYETQAGVVTLMVGASTFDSGS